MPPEGRARETCCGADGAAKKVRARRTDDELSTPPTAPATPSTAGVIPWVVAHRSLGRLDDFVTRSGFVMTPEVPAPFRAPAAERAEWRRLVRRASRNGCEIGTSWFHKNKKSDGANRLTLAIHGSPTWARTRVLRINRMAVSWAILLHALPQQKTYT